MASSKDESSPSNLWTRRQNSTKLSLSTNKSDRSDSNRDTLDASSSKRFGTLSSHGGKNPFNTIASANVASPTSAGGSSAFGLGSGAFASFGSGGKTPKTPGTAFDVTKAVLKEKDSSSDKEDKDTTKRPPVRKALSSFKGSPSTAEAQAEPKEVDAQWRLRHTWVIYYRPPTSKNSDYEKSIKPMCRIPSAQAFWAVYSHLKRPSSLPAVSDYHLFKEGIRPVWEDEENKKGGKWIMRLKKGVADRYWEDLLLAMIGDQFAEASEEVCGAVVSVRSGEDVFSIWTKNDGGRNVKIRETIKRMLGLPPDTILQFKSHDASIEQRNQADQARQEKSSQLQNEKRRSTLKSASQPAVEEEENAV